MYAARSLRARARMFVVRVFSLRVRVPLPLWCAFVCVCVRHGPLRACVYLFVVYVFCVCVNAFVRVRLCGVTLCVQCLS